VIEILYGLSVFIYTVSLTSFQMSQFIKVNRILFFAQLSPIQLPHVQKWP